MDGFWEELLQPWDLMAGKLMVEEAGLGVAYRAKPSLAAVATARLEPNNLGALLWAQGTPRNEWISG